jgi:hypothetical protein
MQALGRRRSRYKRELRELDHELVRIEGDKSKMEDGERKTGGCVFLAIVCPESVLANHRCTGFI